MTDGIKYKVEISDKNCRVKFLNFLGMLGELSAVSLSSPEVEFVDRKYENAMK